MAVDRKADHVGNHGGAYTDQDGMSRQFTYVDHDPKTRISFSNNITTYKVRVDEPPTKGQTLANNIAQTEMNHDELFIALFDEMLKEQGGERFHKGRFVDISAMLKDPEDYPEWHEELTNVFKTALRAKITFLKGYIK